MKLLSQLLTDIHSDASIDIPVSGFALDNRQVHSGMVFVALQGTQQHGLVYAEAAVEAGAVAVMYEPEGMTDLPQLTVPLIAVAGLAGKLGNITANFYGYPAQGMNVVGVTGTDGKTSVTHFIAETLEALGKQAAVIGTIGIGRPGDLRTATHTTPDAISVHGNLRTLRDSGVDTVAMEVSSHALDQGRVAAVNFDIAVLTNLARDHIDYHLTEEAYAAAKRKLFYWPDLNAVVLNRDDAFGVQLADELSGRDCRVLGYGVGNADDYPVDTIVATEATFDHKGIIAQVVSPWGQGELKAPVLGRFNLDNLLATLGVLLLQGHDFAQAIDALAVVRTVPGRMERVRIENQQKDLLAVVDYAHTAGALESVLSAVKAHTRRQLVCVFGCGGDRDAGKRPLMARAAELAADQIIVTDDNPRTEDPAAIFADIRQGFSQPERVQFEHDRGRAIHQAIQQAESGDTVLIAGKGHETIQIVNQENRPFDDREQTRLALQECAS